MTPSYFELESVAYCGRVTGQVGPDILGVLSDSEVACWTIDNAE